MPTSNLAPRLVDSTGRIAARRKRRIKTPPVAEACALVLDAFSTGCASSMLVGKPRLGKTFGARWICETIQELMGPVSWYEIPFQVDKSHSARKFFSHVLRCVPHGYPESRDEDVLRERLEEFLIERAQESSLGTVILILDEAQNLTEWHWTYMAELSNKIDREGLSLFTLSTGQQSLYVTRNTLRELPSAQHGDFIIGRFFLDMNDFRGLRTAEDIRLTLREIDISPLGPKDKQLWLEAALPVAYRAGWRLEQLSDLLWEAHSEVWRLAGRTDGVEIPMTYFDLLIRQIIGNSTTYNCRMPEMSLEVARSLVVASQFEKSIR